MENQKYKQFDRNVTQNIYSNPRNHPFQASFITIKLPTSCFTHCLLQKHQSQRFESLLVKSYHDIA